MFFAKKLPGGAFLCRVCWMNLGEGANKTVDVTESMLRK